MKGEHAAGGNEDELDIDENTDDELEIDDFCSSPPAIHLYPRADDSINTTEACSSSSPSIKINYLVEMGFSHEMIARAIRETGGDAETGVILDTLFKYSDDEKSCEALGGCDIGWSSDDDDNPLENYSDLCNSSNKEDASCILSKDTKLSSLMSMGFPRDDVSTAIQRCGENANLDELADFIFAAQLVRQSDEFSVEPNEDKPIFCTKKRRASEYGTTRGKKQRSSPTSGGVLIRLPNPMIGFGVPNELGLVSHRTLPKAARGPPYFYHESIAFAPKGAWETMSNHLYEVVPEFVDSKYFCAAARKRGYIHNLPICNRFQLQPPPKCTILEAFPLYKRWWPAWDTRTKLNCLRTTMVSAQLTERICKSLENHDEDPPLDVRRFVIDNCRKWNLVWVGRNKVAPLEPDEMETLLGFPKNHTRGGGSSMTGRYKSLGNAFQVDTVAYHLSVLKDLFPDGINVLSLFSGIGGAEVALHHLQIPMKNVVSVEKSSMNQDILRSFWEQTDQKGTLIQFGDVKNLTKDKIEELMDRFGGFDLVIGGSPGNNLSGRNRVSRDGLEGEESSLFFDYCRILDVVRHKEKTMRRLQS